MRRRVLLCAFAIASFSPMLVGEPLSVDPPAEGAVSTKVQPGLAARLGANDKATVRAIVSLDLGGLPPWLKRAGLPRWRERAREIAAAQDRVIGAFTGSGRILKVLRRYKTLSGFSAELTPGQIKALAARDDVNYVEEIPIHYKNDSESFPLTDVDLAQNTGADGTDAVIAIIDDGIDYTLPDFSDKYLGGYDFADNDDDPRIDCLSQSHGTSVAGVALGSGPTSTGVAPDANFVFLKIQSSGICGSSALDGDLIGAIDWAVANKDTYGIDIISISLGGGTYASESACDGSSSIYFNAIRNAVNAGITVIAASGNDGLCDAMSRPACFSDVISVGAVYDDALGNIGWCVNSNTCAATTSGYNCGSGRTAAFENAFADDVIVYSNSASFLDVVAPSTCAATVVPGGSAESCFGGTSSATPFTAGVAALAIESAGKGALTPAEMRALLAGTGNLVIDPKNGQETPRVNGWTAVTDALSYSGGGGGPTNNPPTADFTVNCEDLACKFDASGSGSGDSSIDSYAWTFGDGTSGSGASTSHTYGEDGTYTVTLTVTDGDSARASTSQTVDVSASPSVDPKLHVGKVSGVSSGSWTTVGLPNSYASMVVIASANYQSADAPAVVRIRNAAGSSFDVMVQNPSGTAVSGVTVHYLVVEEGTFAEDTDGIKMEAVKFNSTLTDRKGSLVGESRSYDNSYTNPVVLGQVMTSNDPGWSVFWSRGGSRTNPPSATALWVGKHVSEDGDVTRDDETLAYIVVEAGSGTLDGIAYGSAVGSDIVQGMTNTPPYNYTLTAPVSPTVVIAGTAALDGGDGGWPVLYGTNPISAGTLALGFDEDQIGDSERNHTSEQVAYMVFATSDGNQAPTADFTVNCADLSCSFDASGSGDSDGSINSYAWTFGEGTIVSWSWDFGDGIGTSTQRNPNYTYAAAGTYRVTLTVTDVAGAGDGMSADVTVTEPPPNGWTVLSYDDFEIGWGNWLDGGSDAQLTSSFAIGSQAMGLQDNSSTSESELAESLDLTAYSELKIEFSYVVQSFENSEDFWVRYSSDGGSSWQTVKAFDNDVDFVDNGTRYYPVITIDSRSFAFTNNALIKFECDASGNSDDVYIDNVGILAR